MDSELLDKKFIKLRKVVLCGSVSSNGRVYTEDCLRRAVDLYIDKPIYVDHSEQKSLKDKVGKVERAWFDSGKIYGDILLSPAHPTTRIILWAAEQCPEWCSFSHDAIVDVDETKEPNVVTDIKDIISVDIVVNAATTRHLFESEETSKTRDRNHYKENLSMLEVLKNIVSRLESGELDEETAKEELKSALDGQAKDVVDEIFDEDDVDNEEKDKDKDKLEESDEGGGNEEKKDQAVKVTESRKGSDIGWRVWEFCTKRNIQLTPKQMSILKRVKSAKDAELLCEAFAERPPRKILEGGAATRPNKTSLEEAVEDMDRIIADIRKRKNINLN